MIDDIIKTVGTASVLIAAVAWVIKTLMNQILSKDIETYKNQLKETNLEQEIKFRDLHEKRAKVIAGFYAELAKFKILFTEFTQIIIDKKLDKYSLDPLIEQDKLIRETYLQNKIYFSNNVCSIIDNYLEIHFEGMKKGLLVFIDTGKENPIKKSEFDISIENIDSLLNSIEKEFRGLLGVVN